MHWDICFLSLSPLPLSMVLSAHFLPPPNSAVRADRGGHGGNYSRNAQLEADIEGGGDGKNEQKEGGPSRESTEVQSNPSYG